MHASGGVGGIRTPDTILEYTPLAGERLKPLGHHSYVCHLEPSSRTFKKFNVDGSTLRALYRPPAPFVRLRLQALAEEEGFEPPEALTSTVFKTAALNHSATPPLCSPQPRAVRTELAGLRHGRVPTEFVPVKGCQ